MTRLTIVLDDPEKKALRELAAIEYREPRAQAALIIRAELARLGLIPPLTLSHNDQHIITLPQEVAESTPAAA